MATHGIMLDIETNKIRLIGMAEYDDHAKPSTLHLLMPLVEGMGMEHEVLVCCEFAACISEVTVFALLDLGVLNLINGQT
jgi:hypothetical protein